MTLGERLSLLNILLGMGPEGRCKVHAGGATSWVGGSRLGHKDVGPSPKTSWLNARSKAWNFNGNTRLRRRRHTLAFEGASKILSHLRFVRDFLPQGRPFDCEPPRRGHSGWTESHSLELSARLFHIKGGIFLAPRMRFRPGALLQGLEALWILGLTGEEAR